MTATPFNPTYGANVRLSATSTPTTASILPRTRSLRVVNELATNPAFFIKTYVEGTVNSVVSAKDTIVLPGSSLIIKKPLEDDTIEFVTAPGAVGTALFNVQPGEGGVV